jgi:hypothetical protein
MAERELASLAHHEVETHGQDHIDRRKEDHLGRVGINEAAARLQDYRDAESRRETEAGILQEGSGGTKHGSVVAKEAPGWQRHSPGSGESHILLRQRKNGQVFRIPWISLKAPLLDCGDKTRRKFQRKR